MEEKHRPPAHTSPPTENTRPGVFRLWQSHETNYHLNSNWIWLGWRGKRPAADQKLTDGTFCYLVVRSWILSATLLYLYTYLLKDVINIIPKNENDYEALPRLLSAFGSTIVAFSTTYNCSLWNTRAEELQRDGKTSLERFYMSNNVSPSEWRNIVKAEEDKVALVSQNAGSDG